MTANKKKLPALFCLCSLIMVMLGCGIHGGNPSVKSSAANSPEKTSTATADTSSLMPPQALIFAPLTGDENILVLLEKPSALAMIAQNKINALTTPNLWEGALGNLTSTTLPADTTAQTNLIFSNYDTNQDGTLSLSEFKSWTGLISVSALDEWPTVKIECLFEIFASSTTGMSKSDLISFLDNRIARFKAKYINTTDSTTLESLNPYGFKETNTISQLLPSLVQKLSTLADTNQDAQLSSDELATFTTRLNNHYTTVINANDSQKDGRLNFSEFQTKLKNIGLSLDKDQNNVWSIQEWQDWLGLNFSDVN